MPDLLVNIDVDDLPKAIAFYSDAFGLTVGRRFGAMGVELLGGERADLPARKGGGQPRH